jgi:hypothetical protein
MHLMCVRVSDATRKSLSMPIFLYSPYLIRAIYYLLYIYSKNVLLLKRRKMILAVQFRLIKGCLFLIFTYSCQKTYCYHRCRDFHR